MEIIQLNNDSKEIITQLVHLNNETEDKYSDGTFFKDTTIDTIGNLLIKKGYNTYHESQIQLTPREARMLLNWYELAEIQMEIEQEDNHLSNKIRAALNNGQIF